MCLAVMKERNVVRLGSKSIAFLFSLAMDFLVFCGKELVEAFGCERRAFARKLISPQHKQAVSVSVCGCLRGSE